MLIDDNETEQPNIFTRTPDRNRQRGTGFTNISRLLGANTGAGDNMGSRVASGISNLGQQTTAKLGEAQDKFKAGFQTAFNPIQETLRTGQGLMRNTSEKDNIGNDISDYESRIAGMTDSMDFDDFGNKLGGAAYSGPMGLQNPASLIGRATGTSQVADLAKDNTGQGMLLRQLGAKPGRYTTGMQGLDQALLGGSVDAQNAIRQARRGVTGLGQQAQSQASSAQQMAEQTRQGVLQDRGNIQSNLAGELTDLNQRGLDSSASRMAEANKLADIFRQYDSTPDPKAAGLTDEQVALLGQMGDFGINLDDFNTFEAQGFKTDFDGLLRNQFGTAVDRSGQGLFSDTQKQFGNVLAKSLRDQQSQDLLNKEYNKDVFQGDDDRELFRGALDSNNEIAKDQYFNRMMDFSNHVGQTRNKLDQALTNKGGFFNGGFGSNYDRGLVNQANEADDNFYNFTKDLSPEMRQKIKDSQLKIRPDFDQRAVMMNEPTDESGGADLMGLRDGFNTPVARNQLAFNSDTNRDLKSQVLRQLMGDARYNQHLQSTAQTAGAAGIGYDGPVQR